MHQDIFGSAQKPFSLVAEPKYFYRSASHGAAFDQLHDAIRRRDGFILVTGELGSGKTTLVRSVLEQVDRTTFTSLIEDPSLSEEQLLRVVLQDFGLVSRDEMKRGRLAHASARELLTTLDDFLASLRPLGASALLVIDEAQEMPLETLDQISALAGPGGAGGGGKAASDRARGPADPQGSAGVPPGPGTRRPGHDSAGADVAHG